MFVCSTEGVKTATVSTCGAADRGGAAHRARGTRSAPCWCTASAHETGQRCARRPAALITSCIPTEDDDSPPTNANVLFEICVPAWDGNHEGLEALIRWQPKGPGSIETHATDNSSVDSISDGEINIRLDYGARKPLGGMARTEAWARMGMVCEIIEVTSYGF